MVEISKYNLYSQNFSLDKISELDEADLIINDIKYIKEFEELKSYLVSHFPNINDKTFIKCKDNEQKQMFVNIEEDIVQFGAIKNDEIYYTKGLKFVKNN